jgi:MFS family permease
MADFSINLFQPVFYQTVYKNYQSEFSVAYAFYNIVPSFTGAILGGLLTDKYGQKSLLSKSRIALASSLLSAPFAIIAMLTFKNFWLSIFLICVQTMIQEAWFAPVFTML